MTKYTIDTPKGILSILNDDKIKENFTNGDCFNYKINEQGDTLLTRFLILSLMRIIRMSITKF